MLVQRMPLRQWLGIRHVEGRPRDLAAVEGGNQGVLVDECTSRDVHEMHALFHRREGTCVEKVTRHLCRRCGYDEVIGRRKQFSEVGQDDYLNDG